MIVGAVLNDKGEPICCELWPGNTTDVSSLIPVVDRMRILDTRPVYHQLDETIKSHIFCSFLALVLRKELDKRLESMGLDLEWNDVKRDLLALQEVILDETKNKKVAIRAAPQGSCASIFRAIGVALPQTIREIV